VAPTLKETLATNKNHLLAKVVLIAVVEMQVHPIKEHVVAQEEQETDNYFSLKKLPTFNN
jgi:hypothetical protein